MNKKLFKGALVLFASILMAVSCSNKDNTGPNDPNNPNNPDGTQKPTALEFSFAKATTAKLEEKTTADIVLATDHNTPTQMKADKKTLEIVFAGRDKDKVEAKITKVTGETQANVANYTVINTAITDSSPSIGAKGTAVALNAEFTGSEGQEVIDTYFKYNNETVGKTVVTFENAFAAKAKGSSTGLLAKDNGGVVIIELEIKGKADTDVAGLTAKKTIYVGVKRIA